MNNLSSLFNVAHLLWLVFGSSPLPYESPELRRFDGVEMPVEAANMEGARKSPQIGIGAGETVSFEPAGNPLWALTLRNAKGGDPREIWALAGNQGARWVMPRIVLGNFPLRGADDPAGVVLLYRRNQGNVRYDYTSTYLVACAVSAAGPSAPCGRWEVASSNLANVLQPEGSNWVYGPVEPEVGPNEPGRKSDVHLLSFDLDRDGYRDLVLWRRQCRSMTRQEQTRRAPGEILPDQCDLNLRLEQVEVLWLRYDPMAKQFLEPRPDPRLWLPDGLWWRKLPGLETIAFW